MQLYSTNNRSLKVSLKEAVLKGLPDDNGLYMPKEIPKLSGNFYENISRLSFKDIAFKISKALIGDDIPDMALQQIVEEAFYFDAPVVNLHDNIYALELFHGPTLAFKDFGARYMSGLMAFFLRDELIETNILVATSGDTGSAVASGFKDIPGIKVTILYPKGKISDIQEKQLATLDGNITSLEVQGTFDDCQKLVKQAFLDKELNKRLNLTSANSINISRLIPQSFYYFYAYKQLHSKEAKQLVFSVPSGNFGNLCGGLLAKKMGLPVSKFIASTNINDVVPEYLLSSIFSPRPSFKTISNAMDVGNPSNFARIESLYNSSIDKIRKEIIGRRFTDEETITTIKKVYEQYDYILDPHSAIGYSGLVNYLNHVRKNAHGVFLATAHPVKFKGIVEEAIHHAIDLPDSLKSVMNKDKTSIPMANSYEQLKEILLRR